MRFIFPLLLFLMPLKLLETSDVIIENFRPGAMEKLGLGYTDIKAINSKIVGEKHIKSVLIGPEGTSIKTIAFNAADNELGVYLLKKKANIFNIAGKLSLNEWRGQKNVEFIIDDISVNKNHKNTVPSSIG